MSEKRPENFIIVGLTLDGEEIPPQRLGRTPVRHHVGLRRRPPHELLPYVRPGLHLGEKCVYVAARLYELEPMAYNFLGSFAKDNELAGDPYRPARRQKPTTEKEMAAGTGRHFRDLPCLTAP
jgi:hypothetical protein